MSVRGRRYSDKSKTKQPLPLVETELRTTTVSRTDLKDRYRPMGQKMKTASDEHNFRDLLFVVVNFDERIQLIFELESQIGT